MGGCLDYLLALLLQKNKEIFNRVFCGPEISGEIFEAMNGRGGLGSA